jgi:hypothetical protein
VACCDAEIAVDPFDHMKAFPPEKWGIRVVVSEVDGAYTSNGCVKDKSSFNGDEEPAEDDGYIVTLVPFNPPLLPSIRDVERAWRDIYGAYEIRFIDG